MQAQITNKLGPFFGFSRSSVRTLGRLTFAKSPHSSGQPAGHDGYSYSTGAREGGWQ